MNKMLKTEQCLMLAYCYCERRLAEPRNPIRKLNCQDAHAQALHQYTRDKEIETPDNFQVCKHKITLTICHISPRADTRLHRSVPVTDFFLSARTRPEWNGTTWLVSRQETLIHKKHILATRSMCTGMWYIYINVRTKSFLLAHLHSVSKWWLTRLRPTGVKVNRWYSCKDHPYVSAYINGITYHTSITCGVTYHKSIECGITYHNSITCGGTYHKSITCGVTYHKSITCGITYHKSISHMPSYTKQVAVAYQLRPKGSTWIQHMQQLG